ncbi:unnamed protein product [Cunninghamella blakesleeana]
MTGRVVRSIKNYAKGFSEVQIKVRKATSNDSTGPNGDLLNTIAQLTFNPQDFIEIMDMIDKRLNDKGKNWRHVFKALLLLDYCLHVGSDNVVSYAKENIYVVKTLKEFQHIDDTGTDVGIHVRQKASDIVYLLQDNKRLKGERKKRKEIRERMRKMEDYMNKIISKNNQPIENNHHHNDDELNFALKESKRMAIEEAKKRKQGEDDDLAIAIKLSEQEAIKKEKESQQMENRITPQFNALSNPYSQQSQSQTNSSNNALFQTTNNPYLQQQQLQEQQYQSTGNQFNLFNHNLQQQSSSFNLINQQNPFLSSNTISPFQTPQITGSSRNPFTHPSTASLFENNSFTFNNNNSNGNITNNSHISVFDPISNTNSNNNNSNNNNNNNNNHLGAMVSSSPFTMAK